MQSSKMTSSFLQFITLAISMCYGKVRVLLFLFHTTFVFLSDFFQFFFIKALLNFLLGTKRFVSIKDSLGFSAPCHENFFSISPFSKGARLRKMIVFAVCSWGKVVFESWAYPFGYFWRWKVDEILTIVSFWKVLCKLAESLTLGSPYDIADLNFSSKVHYFLRKFLRARLRPCVNLGHLSILLWL